MPKPDGFSMVRKCLKSNSLIDNIVYFMIP